ncbi:hypothetical protein OGAPHI_006647 [Ogataea philodendri]|uniref:Amino acid transporter transmembrane domain-containing protein n=1 Tax=Ogataea philodendri TaxID=1378263 RepID=A0A9P8NXD1_9ASCO|nr:uncharacterized protein OGAPHI_006647 [Ogataea philodendri]KAH3661240.1 hypothetical protein OGAPHI_006647 [Ogataea philodendri]
MALDTVEQQEQREQLVVAEPDSRTDVDNDLHLMMTEHGKSDLQAAFFNMSNSILGAGVVGIPRAFRNSGLLTSLILMVVLAVLNDWTLRLIIVNTKLSGAKTYTAFVSHALGDLGKVAILLAQGLFGFGGNIGFAVIIGDTIPHVLRSLFSSQVASSSAVDFLLSRNTLIVICITCVSFPLSLTRDISKLAKASGIALASMSVILSIVVFRGPAMDDDLKGSISGSGWFFKPNIFQSISVISFALVCHHNTTFIYDSIRKPTLDRFNRVTHIACVLSGVVCSVMGVCGYLTFGPKTKGNILNNFPSDDWVVNIARLCFGLNMLTTYPLELFVVRAVVRDLMEIYEKREIGNLGTKYHVIITAVLAAVPMVVALFTCNLGAVLELVGATSASLLAFILPPLCYLKMTKQKPLLQRLPYYACVVFGFCIMFLSSTQTIISALNDSGDDHCVA